MGEGAYHEGNTYTGWDENTWATGTSADEIFNLGSGDDTIEFDISDGKTIGVNTAILSKGEKLNIRFEGDTEAHSFDTGKYGKDGIFIAIYYNSTEIGRINIDNPFKKDFAQGLAMSSQNGFLHNDFFAKIIDKTKAKKGQTINGSFYNETILGSKKADKIYTGAGDDRIDAYKGKDKIYINGGGRKEIAFRLDKGSDTLKFTGDGKEAKTILNFFSSSYNRFRKIGKNLYIDNYDNYSNKKVTTQTISDYFDLNDGLSSSLEDYIYINESDSEHEKLLLNRLNYTMIDVYGDKKRNVIGTNYGAESVNFGDYLHGSKKADKIYTGRGNDIINAGKGNDKIYLNSDGYKTVVINNGDGNDTIYCNNFTEDFNLAINGADVITYEKNNNDLILYYTYNNGKKISTGTTVIKDYYSYEDAYVKVNNQVIVSNFKENEITRVQMSKNYTISDTADLSEKIYIGTSKKDNIEAFSGGKTILTGAGDDYIGVYGNGHTISGGKGNDTIYLNTDNSVTINHTTGDGNDIIETNQAMNEININLKLQGNQFNNYDADEYYSNYFVAMRQGFSIKGDDLVMQIPAGLNKFETITFKDYFKEGSLYNAEKININMTVNEHNYNPYYTGTLKKCLEKWSFWATMNYDIATKRIRYDYIDDHSTSFYYNGKEKAAMYGSGTIDTYIVNLNKKSNLIISDESGVSDSLFLRAKQSDLSAFFNVDKYKRVDVTGDGISDDLFIFNKKNLTAKNLKNAFNDKGSGYIRINQFFENSESKWTQSAGYIERIFVGKNINDLAAGNYQDCETMYDNKVEIGATVGMIAEKVAGWLAKHSKYNDAISVINSGNTKDINSLLKCYTSEKIWLNKNMI